jgi:hypothetical protein
MLLASILIPEPLAIQIANKSYFRNGVEDFETA